MRVALSAAGTPRDVYIDRHRFKEISPYSKRSMQAIQACDITRWLQCDHLQTGGTLHRPECIIRRQQLVRVHDTCAGAAGNTGIEW